jgi:hypothetical protein
MRTHNQCHRESIECHQRVTSRSQKASIPVYLSLGSNRKRGIQPIALEYLVSWESEIYIPKEDAFMDYKDFKQPKRQKTK